jgi:hypothetical protein
VSKHRFREGDREHHTGAPYRPHRADAVSRQFGFGPLLAVLLAIIVGSGIPCIDLRRTSARIHYEVTLRDGGVVPIHVTYRLPSGEDRTVVTETPWRSPAMTFERGDMLLVRADTSDRPKSPLLCRLSSAEGSWAEGQIGTPFSTCETDEEFDRWPPGEFHPSLIKVG